MVLTHRKECRGRGAKAGRSEVNLGRASTANGKCAHAYVRLAEVELGRRARITVPGCPQPAGEMRAIAAWGMGYLCNAWGRIEDYQRELILHAVNCARKPLRSLLFFPRPRFFGQ